MKAPRISAGLQTPDTSDFSQRHSAAIAEIYGRGDGDAFGLPPELLATALMRGARAFEDAGTRAAASYLRIVNAADLVLACACGAGIAVAREKFRIEYLPLIGAAALAIVRDEVQAGKLVDSLWDDLNGAVGREGKGASLLDEFHGSSSLATWIRAVTARRYLDSIRKQRGIEPIDSVDSGRVRSLARLDEAVASSIAGLAPRDLIALRFHFGKGLTLAEIGSILGERKWTVSRRLKRGRERIRKRVGAALRGAGLDSAEIDQCYARAIETWPLAMGALDEPAASDETAQGESERQFKA